MKPYKHIRWQIEGTLTTRTNLHIGSGETIQHNALINERDKKPVEIEAVIKDYRGIPYLTGAAIKGTIRSWFKNCYVQVGHAKLCLHTLDRLFGSRESDNPGAVAGQAEFYNAYCCGNGFSIPESEIVCDEIRNYLKEKEIAFFEDGQLKFYEHIDADFIKKQLSKIKNDNNPNADTLAGEALSAAFAVWNKHFPPYWTPHRLTGVAISVAIDRQKKVASDKMLAHWEFVPPGTSFKVVISGKNEQENDIPYLLFALNQFNNRAITLGANTVNGWGQFDWRLDEIKGITREQILEWVRLENKPVGYNALAPLPLEEKEGYKTAADKICANILPFTDSPQLTLGITLTFNSPFLVNDPCQKHLVDHAPLLDHNGKPFLPSKSIRGAFRSQAEKILRTIGKNACFPGKACLPVLKNDAVKKLCPACQLFGASGWQSPIEFSDFTYCSKSPVEILRQEFVAIDRFTGGGAKSNKFNASFVYKPILKGTISVDLRKLETVQISSWALGLLVLTLRDLVEGDITFGFGSSKGYGSLTAAINSIRLTGTKNLPQWSNFLSQANVSEELINFLDVTTLLPDRFKEMVEGFVTNFILSEELEEASNE